MQNEEVVAYLASLPEDRKAVLMALHELVLATIPVAVVDMRYRMPTYHAGEGWVALANQKRYVSLYTCGANHLLSFRDKHPEINTGKGCIRLNPARPLPLEDLADVIRHAISHPKGDQHR